MAKAIESVTQYMKKLKHPRKDEIELLRITILAADKKLTEQIKWNAPSFGREGEDRITFKLAPKDSVDLIFHRGAKVKDSKDFSFEDSSELMEWLAPDRALVRFKDMKHVKAKRIVFGKLVAKWIKATTQQ